MLLLSASIQTVSVLAMFIYFNPINLALCHLEPCSAPNKSVIAKKVLNKSISKTSFVLNCPILNDSSNAIPFT